jgi:Tfp pilus assembly protein PilF
LSDAIAHASRLLSQGDVDPAIALLQPHAEAADAEPMAIFALGTAYLQRGRYTDALPLLEVAAQREPDYAPAHAYLAMAYLHTYQPTDARASMDQAVALAPDDFAVNLKHGEMLMRLGYYRESIEPLNKALAATAPNAASLAFARHLLLLARQKAPNTYTRPVHVFPKLPWRWFPRRRQGAAAVSMAESSPRS